MYHSSLRKLLVNSTRSLELLGRLDTSWMTFSMIMVLSSVIFSPLILATAMCFRVLKSAFHLVSISASQRHILAKLQLTCPSKGHQVTAELAPLLVLAEGARALLGRQGLDSGLDSLPVSLERILYSLPAGTGERKVHGGRPGLGHASCPLGIGIRADDG